MQFDFCNFKFNQAAHFRQGIPVRVKHLMNRIRVRVEFFSVFFCQRMVQTILLYQIPACFVLHLVQPFQKLIHIGIQVEFFECFGHFFLRIGIQRRQGRAHA